MRFRIGSRHRDDWVGADSSGVWHLSAMAWPTINEVKETLAGLNEHGPIMQAVQGDAYYDGLGCYAATWQRYTSNVRPPGELQRRRVRRDRRKQSRKELHT